MAPDALLPLLTTAHPPLLPAQSSSGRFLAPAGLCATLGFSDQTQGVTLLSLLTALSGIGNTWLATPLGQLFLNPKHFASALGQARRAALAAQCAAQLAGSAPLPP